MKSVGEVMSIGRNFKEALGKAWRSLERPDADLGGVAGAGSLESLAVPSEHRLHLVESALRAGRSVDEVAAASAIDPWFVDQIAQVAEKPCTGRPPARNGRGADLGAPSGSACPTAVSRSASSDEGAEARAALGVRPSSGSRHVRREFRAHAHYSAYEDRTRSPSTEAHVILGGGPNRIGQGIEFDYACVHAAFALQQAGFESVMINSNPETVSTDYDTSSRLYFEPLTAEDVLAVCRVEQPVGVIAQFGGERRSGWRATSKRRFPVLGTPTISIDLAEDRGKFAELLHEAGIPAPEHGEAHDLDEARVIAARIGYPMWCGPRTSLADEGWRRRGGRARAVRRERRRCGARSPGADRPLPRGRRRDRRRRRVRRHGRVRRCGDGAHRGCGGPLG
jgi:carbamoyl-phosphate synthase large subunit